MTPSTTDLGTLDWALARGGRMTTRERLLETARTARALGPMVQARAADLFGIAARNTGALTADHLKFPDSVIARDAEQECRDSISPLLVNHSIRTYLFGLMLAERDGLEPDRELFYVACLLHDLTLGDVHRDASPMPCFAARGGLLARDWATEHGWAGERAAMVGNAISLHLNTRIDAKFGPEAQMLQAGAGVDTVGLRHRHLDPEGVREVVARFPRLDLKKQGPFQMTVEGKPGTRAGNLRRLGFGLMVRGAPFAE